jgi:hypothetical protein
MLKIVEIAKAWIAAANPTPEQKALAEERAAICGECPHRNNSWYVKDNKDIWTCGLCGCPLSKKLFTPAGPDACPDKRWKK